MTAGAGLGSCRALGVDPHRPQLREETGRSHWSGPFRWVRPPLILYDIENTR